MTQCQYNTCFQNVNSISEDLILNIIEANFKMYLDWAFLKIGAWIDVQKPLNTIYGGNKHYQLILVDDPSYASGQVWQGIRKDWVWEKNISYGSSSPIPVQSVLINNDTVVVSGFKINHPLGRIIFDNPLSPTSLVEVDYSYRFVQVHRSSESPWFNIIQLSSFNTSNLDIKQTSSGEWSIGADHRVQLPSIIIEPIARSVSRPYEIGSSALSIEQDIGFYILTESKNDKNRLIDILRLQQGSTLQLFDTNLVAQNQRVKLSDDLKVKFK